MPRSSTKATPAPAHRTKPEAGSASLVPAVTRAAAILDLLTSAGSVGMSITDIARELGLAKSSTANLCQALEETCMLMRASDGYRLGPRLVSLAASYLAQVDQITEFYAQCRKSRYVGAEASRLAQLDGLDVLYLATFQGVQPVRLTIGDRLPAHITATGKAMLMTLPEAIVRDRYQGRAMAAYTPQSHTTIAGLIDDLHECAARGFAMDDEETTPGVLCYAVPVVDGVGEPSRLAVSATLLKARADEIPTHELIAELHEIAASLASLLGPRS